MPWTKYIVRDSSHNYKEGLDNHKIGLQFKYISFLIIISNQAL